MTGQGAVLTQTHAVQSVAHWLTNTNHLPTMADAAYAYVQAGLTVFPCWWVTPVERDGRLYVQCGCNAGPICTNPGKHPITRHGVNEATNDTDVVWGWWQRWPQANIGLPAGKNELAALDVDPKSDGFESLRVLDEWCWARGDAITDTITVRTASGGIHYYYMQPEGGIKSVAKAFGHKGYGLDTRGRGGYVVAPPSRGVGGVYEFMPDPLSIQPWPRSLTTAMDVAYPERQEAPAPPGQYTPPTTPRGDWAGAALAGECKAVAATPPGEGRNNRLNAAAYKLGRIVGAGLLEFDTVTDHLIGAARACGLSDDEARKTIVSGMTAGMKKPRGPAPARPLTGG